MLTLCTCYTYYDIINYTILLPHPNTTIITTYNCLIQLCSTFYFCIIFGLFAFFAHMFFVVWIELSLFRSTGQRAWKIKTMKKTHLEMGHSVWGQAPPLQLYLHLDFFFYISFFLWWIILSRKKYQNNSIKSHVNLLGCCLILSILVSVCHLYSVSLSLWPSRRKKAKGYTLELLENIYCTYALIFVKHPCQIMPVHMLGSDISDIYNFGPYSKMFRLPEL